MIGGRTDARIRQAVEDTAAALEQAGVSKVAIFDYGEGRPVEIRPLGGNREEVNRALDSIRDKLHAAGYESVEAPAERCLNSPMELRVTSRPAMGR